MNKLAKTKADSLMVQFWKNKHLRIDSKVRIYKLVIRPTRTYNNWLQTTETKQFLETWEMKDLIGLSIASKILRDHIRNYKIREKFNLEQILIFSLLLKKKRMEWSHEPLR